MSTNSWLIGLLDECLQVLCFVGLCNIAHVTRLKAASFPETLPALPYVLVGRTSLWARRSFPTTREGGSAVKASGELSAL